MRIERIELKDFRNIQQQEMRPGTGLNILHGKNAQGKTNWLEAIWLFTGGRSFRGSRDGELIKFNRNRAQLMIEFEAEGRQQRAVIRLGEKKSVILNGIAQRTATAYIGTFCAVLFSPDHLSMMKEGPGERRRFLDTALSQQRRGYTKKLNRYQKALHERNSLLKDVRERSQGLESLDIWDELLVDAAIEVWLEREHYIQKLLQETKENYRILSQAKEEFHLFYERGAPGGEGKQLGREELQEYLKKRRDQDIQWGHTSIGPHRDDILFFLDGKEVKRYASQGQQRSCVLALKIAEASILGKAKKENPIILMDDVLSELDENRQSYFYKSLGGHQVFLTTCEEPTKRGTDTRIYLIEGGRVKEEKGKGDGTSHREQSPY